jgi:phosphoribosyl 1,2-cyclic phosphodiesterase
MKNLQEGNPAVTFWGTRGSISTPGRTTEKYGGNTSCITIRYQDILIVLDAGTGIRNLGLELKEEFQSKDQPLHLHLFLSHTHWDHIHGLPFFQPAYEKNAKMTIYGSPRKGRFLGSVLKGQMDSEYFPVGMSAFQAKIKIKEISEEVIQLGPVRVDWQEQHHHPGGSVRYRFHINGKTIVYATDVELDRIFPPKKNHPEDKASIKSYLDFVKEADLLIGDGQHTKEEYADKVGWGHSSIDVLIEAAHKARVKQVAVFHHDPQHSDKFLDDFWTRNKNVFDSAYQKMKILWAREGLTLAL